MDENAEYIIFNFNFERGINGTTINFKTEREELKIKMLKKENRFYPLEGEINSNLNHRELKTWRENLDNWGNATTSCLDDFGTSTEGMVIGAVTGTEGFVIAGAIIGCGIRSAIN